MYQILIRKSGALCAARLVLAVSTIACPAFAQEPSAAGSTPGTTPVAMTQAEKAWAESMTNVKMLGFFMVGESKDLHDDAYVIERITKVSDGMWKFAARVQYGGRDVKVTLNVPVQFAGDVPVINFTRQTVPGMGTYDARVMFFKGGYAGTWGAGDHGGAMFGKIVKLDDMPQDTPVRKLPAR